MARTYSLAQKFSSRLSVLLSGILTMGLLAAGCGGDSSSTEASVTQIALSGPSSLAAGLSGQMTATATYSDGSAKDVTSTVTWSSDEQATLAISDDSQNKGLVRALVIGTAHVHAALSGKTGDATITVSAAELQVITITPASPSLAMGTTVQLSAAGTYSDGSTQDITSAVQWVSADQSVVQVSNELGLLGLVTAVGQGAVNVSAVLGNVTASVQLTVTAALLTGLQISASATAINVGDTLQLSTAGSFSDYSTQDLTDSVTWVSSDAGLVSISNDDGSHGLATASASGTVTITASLGNYSASFALTIN
jgi:hypothetical protein